MRVLSTAAAGALMLAAASAHTFSTTRVVEGYEPKELWYEAELVDNVDHALSAHRFEELHRQANNLVQAHHAPATYHTAELVDALDSHSLGDDERFMQARLSTEARTTVLAEAKGDDLLGLNTFSNGGTPSGYTLTGNEFDNPLTQTSPISTIPNAPDCTVRGNTVLEVKKIRKSALGLNDAVHAELDAMHKRKSYEEQMTTYLNDRIRELNKVKVELGSEIRWVFASEAKISQLSSVEKLIKMQDILSCMNTGAGVAAAEGEAKKALMDALNVKAMALQTGITEASTAIAALQSGATEAPAR